MNDETRVPVACSLSQPDLAQRAKRWQALAGQAEPQVTRTDSGLRLALPAGPGIAAEVNELAELERDCCAFARWSVTSEKDRVVLDVTADDTEAIAAIHAMFAQPPR